MSGLRVKLEFTHSHEDNCFGEQNGDPRITLVEPMNRIWMGTSLCLEKRHDHATSPSRASMFMTKPTCIRFLDTTVTAVRIF